MSATFHIRDVFAEDPLSWDLPNKGVADLDQEAVVQWELRKFVCEGQYAAGLERVLRSYVTHWGQAQQPGVWVSGFYGSGKSHLVKVLRYLWADHRFPDGASARGLAPLPAEVTDLLAELSTLGKRAGGLFAAGGKLQQALPPRRALLAILLRGLNLPVNYTLASVILWLREAGVYEAVRGSVEQSGKSFEHELQHLYVSKVLAEALLEAMPDLASGPGEVKEQLRAQFPPLGDNDITEQDMLARIRALLGHDGEVPCSLLVIDELQQYIGQSPQKAYDVQLITEACTKQFGDRLLFVGTGQSALSGTPNLQRLQARFTVAVELSDTDVDTVVRKLVLPKAPDKLPEVERMLQTHSGEIDRHLSGTKISPRPEDTGLLAADYPILPVRRRFWDQVLRAVDRPGTAAQLRTQLRMAHEAVRAIADQPLGCVVPGDFIYDQQASSMLQSGILLRDIHETVLKHRDSTPNGQLRSRLCALCFLIAQLSKNDVGIRASAETLSDLLVDDLRAGSAELRQRVPQLLEELVNQGDLMRIGEEYRLQTREGAAWEAEFRAQLGRMLNDEARIAAERDQLLRARCTEELQKLRLIHGRCKEARQIQPHFAAEPPKLEGAAVPVWIRDGWSSQEADVRRDAHQAGTDSPLISVFLPRAAANLLREGIARWKAALGTLELRGVPSTPEGLEAHKAMETRAELHRREVGNALDQVFARARVFQGGGDEVAGASLRAAVEQAAQNALARLFPQFSVADDDRWGQVIQRARRGDPNPLSLLNHQGETQNHPVCKAVMDQVGAGESGKRLRQALRQPPYGWPQDAIDGALVALVGAGALTATEKGAPVMLNALDQTKIGVTHFRLVAIRFTAVHCLAVRKLLTDAGVQYGQGEELAAVPEFIQRMIALAGEAGGDPPAPPRPSVTHLEDLKQKIGNEQGVAVYDLRDRLTRELAEWPRRAAALAARRPRWQTLQDLLDQAADLPLVAQLRGQAEAIRANRGLLNDPDPVPPLCDTLSAALRQALQAAIQAYQARYAECLKALAARDIWPRLEPGQQQQILRDCELEPLPAPEVATEEQLLAALRAMPLREWRTRTDALPHRFEQALLAAARLAQPEAVTVRLPPGRLSTEAEVDEYLHEAKRLLMEQINAGHPVVL